MDASASKTLLLRKLAMKYLLREFYQLCADGSCQDLLSESEKEYVRQGGMYLVEKSRKQAQSMAMEELIPSKFSLEKLRITKS